MSELLGTLAYNGFILAVAKAHSWGKTGNANWGIMAAWALPDSVLEAIRVLASYHTCSCGSQYKLDSKCYLVYFVEAV